MGITVGPFLIGDAELAAVIPVHVTQEVLAAVGNGVYAVLLEQPVSIRPARAVQDVCAAPTNQNVTALPAGQHVISVVAKEQCPRCPTEIRLANNACMDDVVTASAVDQALGPDENAVVAISGMKFRQRQGIAPCHRMEGRVDAHAAGRNTARRCEEFRRIEPVAQPCSVDDVGNNAVAARDGIPRDTCWYIKGRPRNAGIGKTTLSDRREGNRSFPHVPIRCARPRAPGRSGSMRRCPSPAHTSSRNQSVRNG